MRVVVEDGELVVRQWYGMRVRVPVSSISSVEELPRTGLLAGLGAHGWRGHWTVNTRRRPAARVHLDPPARGFVLGAPVRVRTLDLAPMDAESLRRDVAVGG